MITRRALARLVLAVLPATTATPTTSARAAPDPSTSLTILLGGDVALPTGPNDPALDALGPRVFEHVRAIIAGVDLALCNLESPLTTRPATARKAFPMTMPPERLAWVLGAGFDLVSLANNHMGDAGPAGVADTLAALTTARAERDGALWWTGAAPDRSALSYAHAGVVLTPPGKSLRVALIAIGVGSAPLVTPLPATPAQRRALLARTRTLAGESDVLIVSLHGGTEYAHALDPPIASLSRALVDAGATVVVAHHPHVLRGIERRGAGLVLHGVGNLAFATMTERHKARGATLWGALPILHIVDGRLDRLEVIPLWVDNAFPLELTDRPELAPWPAAALQPRPLIGEHARRALDALDALSAAIPGGAVTTRRGDVGVIPLAPAPHD